MNRTGDKGGELRVNGVEAADGADGVVRRNAMLAYVDEQKQEQAPGFSQPCTTDIHLHFRCAYY